MSKLITPVNEEAIDVDDLTIEQTRTLLKLMPSSPERVLGLIGYFQFFDKDNQPTIYGQVIKLDRNKPLYLIRLDAETFVVHYTYTKGLANGSIGAGHAIKKAIKHRLDELI